MPFLPHSLGQPLQDASGYDGAPFIPELYDYVVPYAARPDIGFYVEAARKCGGPVLELGCGTGRILIPTARAGIDISGLDASERMLAVCRAKLDREPLEVRRRSDLHRGDIRDFDLGRRFQLITLPFRPFQYLLTVDEQLACLGAIWRHLEPNGQLVFDLFNPSVHTLAKPVNPTEAEEEPTFSHPDGRTVTRRSRILERDLATQTFAGELIYEVTHPGGRTERLVHQYRFRYLFRFEAEHLLARAGFATDQVYSGFDCAPYGSQYPGELIFVARRRPAS
jgi:SAM-dependent methyltransferase